MLDDLIVFGNFNGVLTPTPEITTSTTNLGHTKSLKYNTNGELDG